MENATSFFGSRLLEHNIKPSYSRIRIYGYLVENKNHPTVDQIYSELVKAIPTLSKTTVYNTLDLLMEAGLARVLTIEENETRYDSDTSDHGHFKCLSCGAVTDFGVEADGIAAGELKDYRVYFKNVYYKGICPKCLK